MFFVYSDSVQETLNENIEKLNFADEPGQCVEHINQFIEKVTKNNIKDIIALDGSIAAMQLIVVNAIYFKGEWVDKLVLFLRFYITF